MLIVISGLCPAVQVQIKLVNAECVNLADLLCSDGKRRQVVVFVRIGGIVKIGFRLYDCLNAGVHKFASDQIVYGRVLCSFFSERAQMSFFSDITAIYFTEIVVIAVRDECITKNTAVIHFAKAGFVVNAYMGVRAVCRMVCRIAGIPGGFADRDITVAVLYLTEPRHVAAGGFEKSVERKRGERCLPGVWYQQSLTGCQNSIPVFGGRFKGKFTGPENLFHTKTVLRDRKPFETDIFGRLFYPDQSFKCIRSAAKTGKGAADAGADACFKKFMGNRRGGSKGEDSFLTLQDRNKSIQSRPFSMFVSDGDRKRFFI